MVDFTSNGDDGYGPLVGDDGQELVPLPELVRHVCNHRQLTPIPALQWIKDASAPCLYFRHRHLAARRLPHRETWQALGACIHELGKEDRRSDLAHLGLWAFSLEEVARLYDYPAGAVKAAPVSDRTELVKAFRATKAPNTPWGLEDHRELDRQYELLLAPDNGLNGPPLTSKQAIDALSSQVLGRNETDGPNSPTGWGLAVGSLRTELSKARQALGRPGRQKRG